METLELKFDSSFDHYCLQIYHKLFELERICQGEVPKVRLDGAEQDFILRVRTSPLKVWEVAQ